MAAGMPKSNRYLFVFAVSLGVAMYVGGGQMASYARMQQQAEIEPGRAGLWETGTGARIRYAQATSSLMASAGWIRTIGAAIIGATVAAALAAVAASRIAPAKGNSDIRLPGE